ncbi:GIP, partial [Symbiodinium necroappetens]
FVTMLRYKIVVQNWFPGGYSLLGMYLEQRLWTIQAELQLQQFNIRGIGLMSNLTAHKTLELIHLVFAKDLEYRRGIGLLISSLAEKYLEQIHLVFVKDLEYLRGVGPLAMPMIVKCQAVVLPVFAKGLEFLKGIGLTSNLIANKDLVLIQLVFAKDLEYLRGIGLMVSRAASIYLVLIQLVFAKDLEYLRGIGLMVSRTASKYLEQIQLVFVKDLEYLRGIGLMIRLASSMYLEQIQLVFVKDLEYLRGIGLMVGLVVSAYLEQIQLVFVKDLEYLRGIGRKGRCLARVYLEQIQLVFAKDLEYLRGISRVLCLMARSPVVAVTQQAVYQDKGLGVPPVEAAYRPPGFRDSRTYGDYGFERPPGLEMRTQGPVPGPPNEPIPSAGADVHQGQAASGFGSTGPSAMDVLITGMGQLQQVLLKQRSDVVDLEPKAVSELAKLPEYTAETGAIDFQDYLYLAEQQIGTLASGAGDWWSRTLSVAQQAYAEYQTLSPVRRLNVVPSLTDDLRDDKYKKLERKVAALVLASLPKSVRDDLVAYRVQGVHQILYRLMVIFQPGGAQDRAQLLKQLDVTESAPGPAEATAALRRWYRLLQRASDLGVKLPDESLQVKALSVIVKRTSEQNADFKFRLALARTELQIDTRGAYLKGLATAPDPKGKAKASPAKKASTVVKGVSYVVPNSIERRSPDSCGEVTIKLCSYDFGVLTDCGLGYTATSTGYYHPSEEAVRTLVVREPDEPAPAFLSAVAWYESRLQSTAVASGEGEDTSEALLDSGASHAFRPPVSQEELMVSKRVGVSLATGEERRILQNSGGALLSEGKKDATILPMGQLVTLLGCRVNWTPSRLTVIHPAHGKLQVRLRGHCPVLPVTQALSLISELEQKRMESFEKTVQELQLQIKALKEKGMQGWTWEQHLRALREQGDRTHLAGFLHKNPVFSTVKAEALLGIPENIPLEGRDGWNLLKGMPWSRAKRI